MVGIIHHRHAPKHARRHLEAGEQAPRGQAPDEQQPGLPEEFWPLREHAEKVARGEWVNPEHEDWIRALRRKHAAWQRQQRMG